MNPPLDDIVLNHNEPEEEKDGGASYHCDLCDADKIHKLAEEFLPGLASACVDNTIGGLFKSPASVAIDIRREMVDYLVQRSENFVAETVVLDDGPDSTVLMDPHDIITEFVDDFASSKRNFVSRVSGWLLSERREDRIDDFVQEMEINGFWLLNRRESLAQTLLKNVDFKNTYHCDEKLKSREDLEEHKSQCGFRTVICDNEGCNARFSAAQLYHHDSLCPFKILACEQNCSASIMRREMDRHCITVCPMKLVKCPFFSVGCYSSVPQCKIDEHRIENLSSHVLYTLRVTHKEASQEDLNERVEELIKISNPEQLGAARDTRSLTIKVKELEAKLGPMKVKSTAKSNEKVEDSSDKVEVTRSPTKEVKLEESPEMKRDSSISSSEGSDHELPVNDYMSVESPDSAKQRSQSQHNDEEFLESNLMQENLKESTLPRDEDLGLPRKVEVQMERKSEIVLIEPTEPGGIAPPIKLEEKINISANQEGHIEEVNESHEVNSIISSESDSAEQKMQSQHNDEEFLTSNLVQQNLEESPLKREDSLGLPSNVEAKMENTSGNEVIEPTEHENISSPVKVEEEKIYTVSTREDHIDDINEKHEIKSISSSESDSGEQNLEESRLQRDNNLGIPRVVEVQKEKTSDDEVMEATEHETNISIKVEEEKTNSVDVGEEHIEKSATNDGINSSTSSESEE